MLFSLVIPTYNNLHELTNCLRALDRIARKDFEVFVAVDGSTDGTLEWLAQASFHFPLHALSHPNHENRGRSATRNLTLPHLQGKYTLFMDSDMEAAPDLLDQHFRILERGGAISIGTVAYRNRGHNLWVRYTSERGVGKYDDGAVVPFNYFITPNTALPTAYFKECGGFDEAISHYGGEDMELGYRINKQFQPRFFFNAAAIVTTTQPKTLEEALPQLQEYGATGLRYITRKWPELNRIYWVNRCGSRKLGDRLFRFLIRPFFQKIAWWFIRWTPFPIQKLFINYLVISAVHKGYRDGKY
ncbi:MAG TPA: glycosyltransferase [Bacteroidia bacterium]|nr:glycosyltransferase [Bacteroidia bacterium]